MSHEDYQVIGLVEGNNKRRKRNDAIAEQMDAMERYERACMVVAKRKAVYHSACVGLYIASGALAASIIIPIFLRLSPLIGALLIGLGAISLAYALHFDIQSR